MSELPRTTTVRLPPAERRLIEAAAESRGWGPCTYLRRVSVEAARRDIAETALAEARRELAEAGDDR